MTDAALPHLSLGKPADARDFILERRHRLVMRHAPSLGGVLLDFGCGNGAQTLRFAGDFDRVPGINQEYEYVPIGSVKRSRPLGVPGRVGSGRDFPAPGRIRPHAAP